MYKKIIIILILLLTFVSNAHAIDNNKFGIHLAQPHHEDIKKAAKMINSNAGKWGYITLVIQENDKNTQKWQEIFDLLRENHLIPIIRLATQPEGGNWRRPQKEDIHDWVNFLDSLNWVVKHRYIILFNEPNHASEWGGEVDPESYSQIALEFAKKLKEKNPDFFIMLAGFDASAPSARPNYEDEEIYLKKIANYNLFDYLDGWSSHSYPNPGFSGNPYAYGRGTIRTYQWEIGLLKELGVKKDLPVFITETGWVHSGRLSEEQVAENFKYAYDNVWLNDERVTAVTPFVFNYQGEPFLGFSWRKFNSDDYYQQYFTIQSMAKTKGEPEIVEKGGIDFEAPKELVASSNYSFKIRLKNTGQAIWDKDNDYYLKLDNYKAEKYFFSDLKDIRPFEETEIDLHLKTNGNLGKNIAQIVLYQGDKKILESQNWQFDISPLPSLGFEVKVFPKLSTAGDDFEIQIFDNKENLILKKSGLKVRGGRGQLNDIQNVILGKKYRVVILRPYYLPRQKITVLKNINNFVEFEKMFPLDFNFNGKLDWGDWLALFRNLRLIKMYIP